VISSFTVLYHESRSAMPECRERRLLEQAVKVMGRKVLASALKVSEETLDRWVKGEAPMPLLPLAQALGKLGSKTQK
jgi:hypothetical protein